LPSSLIRRKERVQTSITMPRTDSCAVPIGCSVDYLSIIGWIGAGVKGSPLTNWARRSFQSHFNWHKTSTLFTLACWFEKVFTLQTLFHSVNCWTIVVKIDLILIHLTLPPLVQQYLLRQIADC